LLHRPAFGRVVERVCPQLWCAQRAESTASYDVV